MDVLTVMIAVPVFFPITVPELTAATELLLDHVTVLFDAFAGKTVAYNFNDSPTSIVADVLLRDTEVGWIAAGFGAVWLQPVVL